MKLSVASIGEFLGLDTEKHPANRESGLLQVDEGSSHEQQGVWQPRKGWDPAGVTGKAAEITAVIAVELASGDVVAVVGGGVNLYSEAAFDE